MRAMGAEAPSDRPDFDPNKVWGTPEELITTRVDIRDFLLQKMHALRCHRTQIAPDWWFTRVPHEVLRDKFGLEYFIRVVSHVPVDGPEDDLFAGLR
jgi:LmbE family N-acetylglucosaminyl deacetylase